MRLFFYFGYLFILALFIPVDLPVAGFNNKAEIVYEKGSKICFAGDSCLLLSSPSSSAKTLSKIDEGTPLEVVRLWQNQYGKVWIQVQQPNYLLKDLTSKQPNRGWINA